jgi:hypothetical protein
VACRLYVALTQLGFPVRHTGVPIMVPTVAADVSDPTGVIAYAVGVLSAAMRARFRGNVTDAAMLITNVNTLLNDRGG